LGQQIEARDKFHKILE
jgi:tetratricopeptide (TPR) repeat protein